MFMDVRPVAKMRPRPSKAVRRLSFASLTETDIDALVNGEEPLIIEGLDESWPADFRDAPLREIAKFAFPPSSVHVDEKQQFGVPAEAFFEALEAGKNVRIFGATLTPQMNRAFGLPASLHSRLKLFRYRDEVPKCFIGGGGAITPLHHDFEFNANWHYVLSGKRRIYLWTYEQSPLLYKLPLIGLSAIPFSNGFLDCRFAEGHECMLGRGELLYMPPGCWHQVEYPETSMAFTYPFHRTERELQEGTKSGLFWLGLMTFWQGVAARRAPALLALPLVLPMLAFNLFYVPLMLLAKLAPRWASFLVVRPCRAVEAVLFAAYYPLFEKFRKKMWVGY